MIVFGFYNILGKNQIEGCPSGLRCNLGKVVWEQFHRGFESHPLCIKDSPTVVWTVFYYVEFVNMRTHGHFRARARSEQSEFAYGRNKVSPNSEQIEHTVAKQHVRNSGSVEQIQDRAEACMRNK